MMVNWYTLYIIYIKYLVIMKTYQYKKYINSAGRFFYATFILALLNACNFLLIRCKKRLNGFSRSIFPDHMMVCRPLSTSSLERNICRIKDWLINMSEKGLKNIKLCILQMQKNSLISVVACTLCKTKPLTTIYY